MNPNEDLLSRRALRRLLSTRASIDCHLLILRSVKETRSGHAFSFDVHQCQLRVGKPPVYVSGLTPQTMLISHQLLL